MSRFRRRIASTSVANLKTKKKTMIKSIGKLAWTHVACHFCHPIAYTFESNDRMRKVGKVVARSETKVCHSSERVSQHLVNQVDQWRLYSHIDHYLDSRDAYASRACIRPTPGLSNYTFLKNDRVACARYACFASTTIWSGCRSQNVLNRYNYKTVFFGSSSQTATEKNGALNFRSSNPTWILARHLQNANSTSIANKCRNFCSRLYFRRLKWHGNWCHVLQLHRKLNVKKIAASYSFLHDFAA